MVTLVKEHRYIAYTHVDTLVLRIEEFVSGPVRWPDQYRLKMPATADRPAKTFYGSTSHEVAEKGGQFIQAT